MDKLTYSEPEPISPIIKFIRFKIEPTIEYTLYGIGMATIVVGTFLSIKTGIQEWREKNLTFDEITSKMRIQLSETISLGLTFILGAEVVKTFRIPTLFQLLKVSLLVILSQMITYFLDKDVLRLRKEFPKAT